MVECADARAGSTTGSRGRFRLRTDPLVIFAVTGAATALDMTVQVEPGPLWDLVSAVERMPDWRPGCTSARWLRRSGTQPAAGDHFSLADPFGHPPVPEVRCVVTVASRPGSFAYDVLDGQGVTGSSWRYDIAAGERPGTARVRQLFAHGPGRSELRRAVDSAGETGRDVLSGRLNDLREAMRSGLQALTAGA